MNYFLEVSETGSKATKFHYRVVDESGSVISERRSNRVYVACCINGDYYFGRADLVGKGGHGEYLKCCAARGYIPNPVAYLRNK